MTVHAIHVIHQIFIGFLFMATFCSIMLPILYLFAPWTKTSLGKFVMFHYWAYATALIALSVFTIWRHAPPEFEVVVDAVIFVGVAIASILLASRIWYYNFTEVSKPDSKHKVDIESAEDN